MKTVKEVPVIIVNKEMDIWTSDILYINNFQISEHHIDLTTYDFNERKGYKLGQIY